MTWFTVKQDGWRVVRVTGKDRIRFVQGMCMGNVATLQPAASLLTCMLNAKGRIAAVFEVMAETDHLNLVCQPECGEIVISTMSKFAIADDVEFTMSDAEVFRRWENPASVWTEKPLFAAPDLPVLPSADAEILRIEAGYPLWNRDVNPDSFPFESLFRNFIDYKKGCYLGQEPIARVAARGQANKHLVGLLQTSGEISLGDKVTNPTDQKELGTVTSVAVSPRLGAIALATLHRSGSEAGSAVNVGSFTAKVCELPFPSSPPGT